ncbi:eryA [Symbiodinium sp. CCMP2592]|nr:eryA [Symbiodinium sp. CCMP2592]
MHSDGGQRGSGLVGQRGYSTCRRDRWRLMSFACCSAMVSTSWIASDKLAWCFGGGGMASRSCARAHLQQRQLFGGFLDPSDWQRDSFVGESLSLWLPSYPPKTEVVALAVEPSSDRYWSYLKPEKCKWYMDKIVAVGEKVGDLEERTLMFMKAVRSPSDLLRMAALISTDSDDADCERHGCAPSVCLWIFGKTRVDDCVYWAALRRMFLMLKDIADLVCITYTLFAGCIASLGLQADWRNGSAWYALLYSELFVLALLLAWLQKALHLLSAMPRSEVFREVLGRLLTWRVHQAMGIASLGLRDPGLVLVSWLVLSALTEAAGSAIDSFVKATSDRKNAGEELLIRKQRSELLRLVQTVAADTLAIPIGDLPLAAPLGADSATAVRFSVALEKELEADLAGKRLPATLLFDFPTLTEIVEGLPELAGKPAKPVHVQQVGSADLLISAFSCELPGASDLQELWPRLQTEVDDVQEVPIRRWDWADAEIPGARHGSFLEGADLFDASFFGLQSAEAQAMDPQQRLLLRTSYEALAQSGHDKGTLLGAPYGVFAAVSNQDWYSWSFSQEHGPTSVFAGTGVAAALAANRISFSLGLRGPSMTIDTACSSSLTALSAASAQLQRPAASGRASRRRIRESVAAGCELLLGPKPMQLRHAAGMLSRCSEPAQTVNRPLQDLQLNRRRLRQGRRLWSCCAYNR